MLAASDFSCAARGIARPAAKQGIRAKAKGMRIVSMLHRLCGAASSLSSTSTGLRAEVACQIALLTGLPVLTLALPSVCGSTHGIFGSSSLTPGPSERGSDWHGRLVL